MGPYIRLLDNYSRVKPAATFLSFKTRCHQYCESYVEIDACITREFSPLIDTYITQPASFGYRLKDGSRLLRYTPDALVRTVCGQYYYEEVKPYNRTLSKKFERRFKFLQRLFETIIGVPLKLNYANTRHPNKSIANYELLYPYRQRQLPLEVDDIITSDIWSPSITPAEVEEAFMSHGLKAADAWTAIAHDRFHYSNSKLITPSSILEVSI